MADSPPMDVPATKRRKARSKGALARRAPRRPITARLALSDDGLRRGGAHKDDIGIISEDLVRDLFPGAIKSWRGELGAFPIKELHAPGFSQLKIHNPQTPTPRYRSKI